MSAYHHPAAFVLHNYCHVLLGAGFPEICIALKKTRLSEIIEKNAKFNGELSQQQGSEPICMRSSILNPRGM